MCHCHYLLSVKLLGGTRDSVEIAEGKIGLPVDVQKEKEF